MGGNLELSLQKWFQSINIFKLTMSGLTEYLGIDLLDKF